ncbi:hypothetical protein BMF94_6817 [Rhodotorula taiwanensis]|uniref:CSD domain-containing protein n=1 Tax=Rhodotorula taiwanensis TaxID=741276 RepID=A0A2S5B0C6_9BASI|nr:hypothetical protein BMF94_6817 [Rhodotorula taiwanensis]
MKQDVGGGQSRGASQGGRAATRTSPDIAGRSKRGLADLPLDTSPLSSFVALEDALPSIKTSIPTGLTSALAEYSPTEASPTTEGAQQEAGPNRFLRRFLHRHVHDGEVSEGEEDERSDKDAAKMPRRRGVCKFFNAQKGFGFVLDDYADELGGVEVFVHYTAITSVKGGPNGFKSLAEGENVEYSIAPGPKGWQAQNVTGPNDGGPGAAAAAVLTEGNPNQLHDPYRPVLIQAYTYHGHAASPLMHYTTTSVPGGVPDGAVYEPFPYVHYGETRPSQAPPTLAFYPPVGPMYPHAISPPSIHVHGPAYPPYHPEPFVPASPIYQSFSPTSPNDSYQSGFPGPASAEPVYPISHHTSHPAASS